HEPHSRQQAEVAHESASAAPARAAHVEDQRHVEFVANADLLIHDAQYLVREYPTRRGWGHSTTEFVVELALSAGVRRVALFHHDPSHSDDLLDEELVRCRSRAAAVNEELQVMLASEAQTIEIAEPSQVAAKSDSTPTGSALVQHAKPDVRRHAPSDVHEPVAAWLQARGDRYRTRLLVAAPDADSVEKIREALRPEGFLVMPAVDGQSALDLAREHQPVLIFIDDQMPDNGAAAICQSLRSDDDEALRTVPTVLLAESPDEDAVESCFGTGFTDYLTKPFTAQYLRSRTRTWLMRAGVTRD
ncbi:MAG: response regulator, partial [Chloroflexi bacterium]|nr:response regulator [Chloroflexota bacterium]